ncbi:hypothetical protein K458DRAFT_162992 [Lentithecium fluviatile CBS 122367]|uniref:Uncharacterized protein n=1 Tax=Lentithecium fluviatile CBS 122367 TaxID=1168545 RepID=A0A6G1IGA2_9PLEO|nr:hypothetical protein K458DRAFT_162992 [Lentithecium fluviatile CBS 122367]
MFDLCSERLLSSDERFAERNGHRFVEIWNCEDERLPIYRLGELKEKEIVGWLHEERSASGPIQTGLRVLLSPKPSGKLQPSSGKLPFTRQTYFALTQAWRIPSTFLRAVTQKLSIVTQCTVASTPCSVNSSPTIPWFAPTSDTEKSDAEDRISTISDGARCLLVRGDVDWTWDYTLLVTHDPKANMTYVLIVGLTATEIDLVLSYLTYISTSPTSAISTHPALLPMVLLDLAADETSSLLKLRIKLLSQIQQRTGMDRFNSLKSATIAGERRKSISEERKELDLDAVMLRLTCLSDWVAAQRGFVRIQERVIEALRGMLNEEGAGHGKTAQMFRERLEFVKETLMAAEQKCQYLERSISAQVQTIYSLIAQKDNRLNHSATRASCQIASDSRRIAILTRRDSTDMRIIAAVTLIFLPGTFVATVFSTGLFDWGSGDPTPAGDDADEGRGKIISKYIWVYFMLTGVLTAIVLLGWGLFSYVQKRKMTRLLSLGVDEEWGGDGDEWQGERKRRETEATLVDGERNKTALKNWAQDRLEGWALTGRKRKDEQDTEENIKIA